MLILPKPKPNNVTTFEAQSNRRQEVNKILKGILCAGAVIGTAAYLSPLIFQASYFNFCVMTTSGINDSKRWSQLNSGQQANLTAEAVQICNGGSQKYSIVD